VVDATAHQIDEDGGAAQRIDDGEEGGHDQDGGLNDRGYFLTDVDHLRDSPG
jgi:hypothetical protein